MAFIGDVVLILLPFLDLFSKLLLCLSLLSNPILDNQRNEETSVRNFLGNIVISDRRQAGRYEGRTLRCQLFPLLLALSGFAIV